MKRYCCPAATQLLRRTSPVAAIASSAVLGVCVLTALLWAIRRRRPSRIVGVTLHKKTPTSTSTWHFTRELMSHCAESNLGASVSGRAPTPTQTWGALAEEVSFWGEDSSCPRDSGSFVEAFAESTDGGEARLLTILPANPGFARVCSLVGEAWGSAMSSVEGKRAEG